MLEREYTNVEPAKPPPPIPVRVSRKSQLMAALQQNARPIVIEDHDLAGPFARLLRARELRLWAFGGLVADTMSFAMSRSYGADIEFALVHRPLRAAGQRAEGDPQAEGTALRAGSSGALAVLTAIFSARLARSRCPHLRESGRIADIGGRLKSALTGREESQQIAVPRAGLP